jgi:hypothetical protein
MAGFGVQLSRENSIHEACSHRLGVSVGIRGLLEDVTNQINSAFDPPCRVR